MIDYFTMEPMRYYAPPASFGKEAFRTKLQTMISSNNYIWAEKIDGNWSRAIITPERSVLQTRGISVKTKTYGEIQDKVLFWTNVCQAFKEPTVILGEIYREGEIDRDIGSTLRCLPAKALARQKNNPLCWYVFDVLCYNGIDLCNTPFIERISYIEKVVTKINSPLVRAATYKNMDSNFFTDIETIFSNGGEGAVCYKKSALYEPGKRGPHAWDSVKVKQEISDNIDFFIIYLVHCEKAYRGGDIGNWELWRNTRTDEKVTGKLFNEYQLGGPYEPISRNYFNNYPGAITVGVYDSHHNIVPLCNVAGLTDEMKASLRDEFKSKWYLCPVSIGGMMVSTAGQKDAEGNGISVRHPHLISVREEDISPDDCTLAKIFN